MSQALFSRSPASLATKPHLLESERSRRGFAPQDAELDAAVRAFQTPSTRASLRAFAGDWLAMGLTAVASYNVFRATGVTLLSVSCYLVAAFIIGSRQKGLENLMHEATHLNLSADHRVNDRMALSLAGFVMAPGWRPALERPGHVAGHHEHFGDIRHDREFFGYQKLGLGQLPTPSRMRSAWILSDSFLRTTWWRLHGAVHSFGVVHVLLSIVALVLLVLSPWLLFAIVLYWFLPYAAIYMPMRFLAEVSEHMALGLSSEFETTRNKLGWFQEYVMHPHGDGYHLVHHLYPRIPHQHLRTAHRLLMRDPVYQQANHCYGLFLSRRRRRATLHDLFSISRTPAGHPYSRPTT